MVRLLLALVVELKQKEGPECLSICSKKWSLTKVLFQIYSYLNKVY